MRHPLTPFIDRTNDRTLAADFDGDVCVWDIDKTYLDTNFSSLRGLAAIPLEFASDKRAVPGSVPLLRALRRGPHAGSAIVPLYFVSGSPPQLREVIQRKMLLDGVDFDGVTFKDQLRLLRAGRPGAIREQVGYKLAALLHYRHEIPGAARWWLFGDDVESDSVVLPLLGEVCAGLRDQALDARLRALGVAEPERAGCVGLARSLPVTADPVARVFIHASRRAGGPRRVAPDAPRVVRTRSFLQAALVLARDGRIRADALPSVAAELRRAGRAEAELLAELDDARVRLDVPRELLALARA